MCHFFIFLFYGNHVFQKLILNALNQEYDLNHLWISVKLAYFGKLRPIVNHCNLT